MRRTGKKAAALAVTAALAVSAAGLSKTAMW